MPRENAWVMEIPVLSTAHLTQETFLLLMTTDHKLQPDWRTSMLVFVAPDLGAMVWIEESEDDLEGLPEDLVQAIKWAKEKGYSDWLRFDADGDDVVGLDIHNWA